jgi:outer membrane protein assembly factor BamB
VTRHPLRPTTTTTTMSTTTPARPVRRLSLARTLACAAVAAAALAGGCHKAPPAAKPAGPLPVNSFMRAWGTTLDLPKKDGVGELHVRDDAIYVYSKTGRVNVIKRDTGILQSTYDIKGGATELHPPVVLKEHVVYPTLTTLEVYMRDGRFVRSSAMPFAVLTDAAGLGTSVFVCGDYPGGGARVSKVDINQQYVPVVWNFIGQDGGKSGFVSGVVVVEDAVYVAGLDGNVYAVSAKSREAIWPIPGGVFKTGGAIEANLVADTSGVYVASTDSILYALNRNSGKLRWRYYAGAPLREAPVVTSDRVYLNVPGKGMVAFAKNEGKDVREPIWTRGDVRQVLAQDDKFTYARSNDDRLVALDKTTGEPRFQSNRKDFAVFGVNTKDDGVIFAASKSGTILAIKGVFKPGVIGEQVRNDLDADGDAGWQSVAVAAR